jgi:hypothetical protein
MLRCSQKKEEEMQQKSLEISSLWSSATADKEPRTGRLEGSRKSTGGTQLMFI